MPLEFLTICFLRSAMVLKTSTADWNYLCLLQAVIFVDNSGADVILGILPFARELLRHGTTVI